MMSAIMSIWLPPFGNLNNHFLDVLNQHPLFPNDWTSLRGVRDPPLQQWLDWRRETLDIINENLWPTYDPVKGWPKKSIRFMLDLTALDFKVLAGLRHFLDEKVNGSKTTHREFFEVEDTKSKPFGSMHNIYDPDIPYRLLEMMPG